MKFFSARNLTEQSVTPAVPWDFKIVEEIGAQIRQDKNERQNWYRQVTTSHSFYTGIEGSNPNQRCSKKDNPPRFIHAFCVDYDLPLQAEAVAAGITAMKIKPQWVERSLSGNFRLVWILPRPLPVESYEFSTFILDKAVSWLQLEVLPGLDRNAFTDSTRLLCNGGIWKATGFPEITEHSLQTFFVESGSDYRFKAEGVTVPLDLVEKGLRAKFPGFSWPGEFIPESQGPSFWVPGSTSAMSAIVKPEGMFTFSAHAVKPFYSWQDILGADFIKDFTTEAVATATTEIYWDEKKFWRKKKDEFVGMDMPELQNYFKCECRLTAKPDNTGITLIDKALNHIYSNNYVTNAAPYLFRHQGILVYQGKRRLNTYLHRLLAPAEGKQEWGPTGGFPFISLLLDNLFTPEVQLAHFLAWWKYFYTCGFNMAPNPGQVVFLMGGVGVGKTFLNREMVGKSVGGFVDASSHIIKGGEFNTHLYEVPHWCVDDDTISDSPKAQANVQAVLKKSVANSDFMVNKKFHNSGMTEWTGRIICTTNLDYVSSRMLGPMDGSVFDKINVFRCHKVSPIKFPSRDEQAATVQAELPKFLRWLLDWEPPDFVLRDTRFGFKAYQEATLMEQSNQTSKVAPFKEILLSVLDAYFKTEPLEKAWRGTVTRLLQLIHMDPLNECIIRTLRLEQVNRYLEVIEKEGIIKCHTESGRLNTRIWVFDHPEAFVEPAESPTIEQNSKFQKQ